MLLYGIKNCLLLINKIKMKIFASNINKMKYNVRKI